MFIIIGTARDRSLTILHLFSLVMKRMKKNHRKRGMHMERGRWRRMVVWEIEGGGGG